MLKNLLLKNLKVDEAATFQICLWHCPLHEFCYFLFDQKRSLVTLATLFIVVVILDLVSVYKTIGPLVLISAHNIV